MAAALKRTGVIRTPGAAEAGLRGPGRKYIAGRTLSALLLCVALTLCAVQGRATVISDRAGGAIYWGGKYVNIKPSAHSDVIGRRTIVDQMEVVMKNDIMTITITGPYFFNYVHKVSRTQDAPPGDLYISSTGWKVSGNPPYTTDIFEASEGWDYVVSLERKKVYALDFPKITMTSALPHERKYREHQAWRGGYGAVVDDAVVTLTDHGLTFIFSVRNMKLGSEIGLHWTMKCGNDIIEGSALVPPIVLSSTASPAPVEALTGDGLEPLAIDPAGAETSLIPVGSPTAPLGGAFPSASGGSSGAWTGGLLAGAAPIASLRFGSDDGDDSVIPGNGPSDGPNLPVGPNQYKSPDQPPSGPDSPTPVPEPFSGPDSPKPVPEPVSAVLLLAGLSGVLVKKLFARQQG